MPRTLKNLLAVVASFCLLYTAYWFVAAYVIEDQIRSQVEKQQRQDRSFSIGQIDVTGFPLRFSIYLHDLEFNDQGDGITFASDGPVKIKVPSYAPWRFEAKTGAEHNLFLDDPSGEQAFQIEGAIRSNGRIGFDQRLKSFFLDASDLRVLNEEIGMTRIGQLEFTLFPDKQVTGSRFELRAGPLSLPATLNPGLGSVVDSLSIDGVITPYLPKNLNRGRLKLWARDKGELILEALSMKWGEVTIASEGKVFFDDKLLPVAALDLSVDGHKQALQLFADRGLIPPTQATVLKFSLAAFTKPKEDGSGERYLFIPLSLKDLLLKVGPITMKLPSTIANRLKGLQ